MRTKSLCPELGKKHAKLYEGMCPTHTSSPKGKTLKTSFAGTMPYIITYDPISGSDYIVTRLLAQRHGFIPRFISLLNNSYHRLVEGPKRVGLVSKTHDMKVLLAYILNLFQGFYEAL